MIFWLSILSLVIAAAWTPMLERFFFAWHRRRNPLSLAICGLIGLTMYDNVMTFYYTPGAAVNVLIMLRAFHVLVLANFYVAAYWSDKRFRGNRAGDPSAADQGEG